ncbi:hypothetical protein ACJ41O_003926 [Fusarium nematophilum]
MSTPPPPPPHGGVPKGSGLPPGKYDIFVIPEHSAGGGFLYLPSMQPNVNSFAAGFASALILVVVCQTMAPAFRTWWEGFHGLGNMAMGMLVIGVGFGAWSLGRFQHQERKTPGQDSGNWGHDGSAGWGSGFRSANAGSPPPPPPHGSAPPPPPHNDPPPRPPPQHDGPKTSWQGSPKTETPPPPPPQSDPRPPPPPRAESQPPRPPPQARPPPPQTPPETPPPKSKHKPRESSPPPKSRPQTPPPAPKPRPEPEASPAPKPSKAETPKQKGSWEKAREEMRKKEEERKAKEAEQKRREDAARRLAELRARDAKERQEREKERERKEREARERKERLEAELRTKELAEKLEHERKERERLEKEAKEAREREEQRLKEAREVEEKKKREAEEREARRKKYLAEREAQRKKEAEEAKLREEQRKQKELEEKKEKEREERRKELERQREREKKEREELDKQREKAKAEEEPVSSRQGTSYAYSGVGERMSMWPNGRPPAPAQSTTSSSASRKPPPSAASSARKPPPSTTAKSGVSTENSYRPYDKQPQHKKSASSIGSESSWAASQTTGRTSPPPSVRSGPYSTKDPDKIVISGVYLFMNQFSKTPASQLISGVGTVTDGLILRITTEGLFIDDDVRSVPQREWDVKAWTLKQVEVWCPPHCLNSSSSPSPAPGTKANPLLHKMAASRARDRGATKALTGDEADVYLTEMLRACKSCCRLGLCDRTFRDTNIPSSTGQTGQWKAKGLHLLRATVKNQEGKRYLFVIDESESWKVSVGLQRLRRGTQVRQLGVSGIPAAEARGTLEMLGWAD